MHTFNPKGPKTIHANKAGCRQRIGQLLTALILSPALSSPWSLLGKNALKPSTIRQNHNSFQQKDIRVEWV
jgi:hypothetical protein